DVRGLGRPAGTGRAPGVRRERPRRLRRGRRSAPVVTVAVFQAGAGYSPVTRRCSERSYNGRRIVYGRAVSAKRAMPARPARLSFANASTVTRPASVRGMPPIRVDVPWATRASTRPFRRRTATVYRSAPRTRAQATRRLVPCRLAVTRPTGPAWTSGAAPAAGSSGTGRPAISTSAWIVCAAPPGAGVNDSEPLVPPATVPISREPCGPTSERHLRVG